MAKELIFDIETTGLESIRDKIICISIYDLQTKGTVTFCEEDEKNILLKFWTYVHPGDFLIGFNSDNFDIVFIKKRSLINNVCIKKINSIDLRKEINSFGLSFDKYEKGTIGDWAKIMGIKQETEDGSKMSEYYKNKEWSKIQAHCEEDVLITTALFERCNGCGIL